MTGILDLGWVLLLTAASLLPILITALRGVLPGRRRLIGLLTIACMLARGFGYLAWSAWLLLPLTCGWALLMVWAATAKTLVDAPNMDPVLGSEAQNRGDLARPRTDPGTPTPAAT